jgi:succinoglycan biosynthesis protein ExoO
MTSPRATVLIPVYNSASTLLRCLHSAMAQTLQDIEILVADDASTDASATIAEQAASLDARIRVLRLPRNVGKPAAMNTMVKSARGEWIAVLDADDAYHPSRLETLIDAAESRGVDMAADNQLYVDSGVVAEQGVCAGFGTVTRTAFTENAAARIIAKADLVANASSFGDFDVGILKPVVRTAFILQHGLAYDETSRLSEDFTYLMRYFVAGGRGVLCAAPMYYWTMPFGTLSRSWTQTGAGPWRYDYRPALQATAALIAEMRARGEFDLVSLLQRRARQYKVMIHYLDAQRHAAEGRKLRAVATLISHPNTYSLLVRRVTGRAVRSLRQIASHRVRATAT